MAANAELKLLAGERVVLTTNIDTTLGKRNFQHIHEDARYLSDPQFRLFKVGGNTWEIEHDLKAVNETLLDGSPVRGRVMLSSGSTITVGNSGKGIQNFPLTCAVADTVDRPEHPPRTDVPPPEKVDPPSSKFWTNLVSDLSEMFHSVNWSQVGSFLLTALRGVLTFAATILSAIFVGLLRGAGTGSSGGTQIRRGNSTFGDVILTIDGKKVRAGNSMFGPVLMTFEGNQIRSGDSIFGTVLATVEGDSVREGNSIFGTTIATIHGNAVHEGTSMFGTVIATIDGGGRMAGAAAAVFLLRM